MWLRAKCHVMVCHLNCQSNPYNVLGCDWFASPPGLQSFHPSELPDIWHSRNSSTPHSSAQSSVNSISLQSPSAVKLTQLLNTEETPLLMSFGDKAPADAAVQSDAEYWLTSQSQPAPLPMGTAIHFWLGFIMCFFLPFLLPICMYCRPRTHRWLQGGSLGATLMAVLVFSIPLVLFWGYTLGTDDPYDASRSGRQIITL